MLSATIDEQNGQSVLPVAGYRLVYTHAGVAAVFVADHEQSCITQYPVDLDRVIDFCDAIVGEHDYRADGCACGIGKIARHGIDIG